MKMKVRKKTASDKKTGKKAVVKKKRKLPKGTKRSRYGAYA